MRAMRFKGNGKKKALFSSCPSRTVRSNRLPATIRGSLIVEGDVSAEKATRAPGVRDSFEMF